MFRVTNQKNNKIMKLLLLLLLCSPFYIKAQTVLEPMRKIDSSSHDQNLVEDTAFGEGHVAYYINKSDSLYVYAIVLYISGQGNKKAYITVDKQGILRKLIVGENLNYYELKFSPKDQKISYLDYAF